MFLDCYFYFFLELSRCSTLILPYFPSTHYRGIYKQNTCSRIPLGCAVHHLACAAQNPGDIRELDLVAP